MAKNATQIGFQMQAYQSSDDIQRRLGDIVTDYLEDRLKFPRHQRGAVWSKAQQELYISALQAPVRPLGVFATYQIEGNINGPTLLNDGGNRLRSALALHEDPLRFNMSKQESQSLLANTIISVQHRIYQDHKEAALWFQRLNIGTSLTPYEFAKGALVYMKGYKIHWKQYLKRLHCIISDRQVRMGIREQTRRTSQHKQLRHDYVLLYRFLLPDKELNNAYTESGSAKVSLENWESETSIEYRLRDLLQDRGIEEAKDGLSRLKTALEQETVTLKDIWTEVSGSHLSTTTAWFYRWVIELALWRRLNNIPVEAWEQFLHLLFRRTRGKARIDPLPRQEQELSSVSLQLSNLKALKRACVVLESDLYNRYANGIPRRRPATIISEPGTDHSHKKPFTKHGDGPVILEPAGRNRARGASIIEEME